MIGFPDPFQRKVDDGGRHARPAAGNHGFPHIHAGPLEDGAQVGVWTTYDKSGRVYKVTDMDKRKKT